jgi:hypothetical protein
MSRLIQVLSNNKIEKKYNTNNIYTMNFLTDANMLMKPVISGASILAVKYSVTGSMNFAPTDYALAGGIAAGFLAAKLAKPIIDPYTPEWLASRGMEILFAGGALYALNAAKLIQLDFSKQNIQGLGVLLGTIVIADVIGEAALPFISGHSI